jgi:histidyl-tRNA synthetase
VDLPALRFGMGDVVLSELLRARKLMPPDAGAGAADLYVVGPVSGAARSTYRDALQLVRALRDADFSVEYPLSEDRYMSFGGRNKFEPARKSGARAAIFFDAETPVIAKPMRGPRDAPAFAVRIDKALRIENPDELRQWLTSLNESPSDG